MEKVEEGKLYYRDGIPLMSTVKHPKYVPKEDLNKYYPDLDERDKHNLAQPYNYDTYEHEGETYLLTNFGNKDKEKVLLEVAGLLNESLKIDQQNNL